MQIALQANGTQRTHQQGAQLVIIMETKYFNYGKLTFRNVLLLVLNPNLIMVIIRNEKMHMFIPDTRLHLLDAWYFIRIRYTQDCCVNSRVM